MSLSRREFVQRSAAVAGAVALTSRSSFGPEAEAAEGAADESLPIVDTHQHLWDLDKFKLPWLAEVKQLARSYVTKDYLEAVEGLNVVQAVYMEVDVDPSQQTAEAEHLLELAKHKANLTVAAVISGRPASSEFKPYIEKYRRVEGIKGVRQVLHVPETKAGYCLQPTFVSSVRLLGEMNKSFDLCMRPAELADAVKLAELCPDTRLILDHCGNADPKLFGKAASKGAASGPPAHDVNDWRRQIEALAKRPNTLCKISGIVASAPKGAWSAEDLAPVIDHCLDAFGPDRVIFGSDWPVCTLTASLREWVSALREIVKSRPLADRKKLFAENARRYYRLA